MSPSKQTAPRISSEARRYINRHFHIIFQRIVYVLLFATIQIAVIIWLLARMHALIPYFVALCTVISLLAAIHIINKNNHPAIKIAWLIPLFTLPIFGGLLYLMFGARRVDRRLTTVTETMRNQYRTPETAAHTREAEVAALAHVMPH